MALVFTESFDHYSGTQAGWKWDTVCGTPTFTAAAGRRGTQAFAIATQIHLTKTVCSLSCYVVGFAFKFAGVVDVIDRAILRFSDGAANHLELVVSGDGDVARFYVRTSGATVVSSMSYFQSLRPGQFYYVEMKAEISASISAGGVEVKIDGLSAMTLPAGTNTRNSGAAQINSILLGPAGNPFDTITFDDVYIIDTTGNELNNFLGDIRIDAVKISSPGTVSNWTPSSAGAAMISMIASTFPDSNLTYMFASVASAANRFRFSSMPSANGSIYGFQLLLAVARSNTTSAKSIAGLIFTSGTSQVGSTTTAPNTSYAYLTMITSSDASGASWSSNTLFGTEFGVKIVS